MNNIGLTGGIDKVLQTGNICVLPEFKINQKVKGWYITPDRLGASIENGIVTVDSHALSGDKFTINAETDCGIFSREIKIVSSVSYTENDNVYYFSENDNIYTLSYPAEAKHYIKISYHIQTETEIQIDDKKIILTPENTSFAVQCENNVNSFYCENITINIITVSVNRPECDIFIKNTVNDGKLKIMCLGDSITNGFTVEGGYRNTLCGLIEKNGLDKKAVFVGSLRCGNGYSPDHEGHSGWAIENIPPDGDCEKTGRRGISENTAGYMDNHKPDIVILMIGTNDILSQYDIENMPHRLKKLVNTILDRLPENGRLYLANIPYIKESAKYNETGKTQSETDSQIDYYNSAVRNIASSDNRIIFADINSLLCFDDLQDGIHPNKIGYEKMGIFWFNKIKDFIK